MKSAVLNNQENRSQRRSLRLGSCLSGSGERPDVLADLLCFKARTIRPRPPVGFQAAFSALDIERQFAVQASRRKLRMKPCRNFTTNKVACFTQIERRSTPLLRSGCSGGRVSCLSRWGAGFAPVPPGVFWINEPARTGFEVDGFVLCPPQRIRNLRSARLEKELVAQQESRFVT